MTDPHETTTLIDQVTIREDDPPTASTRSLSVGAFMDDVALTGRAPI